MTRYTIRYRCEDGCNPTTLVVDDRRGTAYLFSRGQLHVRLTGGDACARLVRLLGRRAACVPVPEVDPYTLAGLRRLTEAGHSLPAMTAVDGRSRAGNGADYERAVAPRPGSSGAVRSGPTNPHAAALEG